MHASLTELPAVSFLFIGMSEIFCLKKDRHDACLFFVIADMVTSRLLPRRFLCFQPFSS